LKTDLDLLNLVRRGDPAGATGLFEKYADALLRFADRMLTNRAEAEEITQEVFLKMITRVEQYDGRAAVSSWLFAIAANACRDRMRLGEGRGDARREHQRRDVAQIGIGEIDDGQAACACLGAFPGAVVPGKHVSAATLQRFGRSKPRARETHHRDTLLTEGGDFDHRPPTSVSTSKGPRSRGSRR